METTAELETPTLALDIDRGDVEVACGLIARDDATDGGGNRHIRLADSGDDLLGQGLAQALAALGSHEHQVLLQEDRAVQAGGQNEVTFAEGTSSSKFVENIIIGHGRRLYRTLTGPPITLHIGPDPALSRP